MNDYNRCIRHAYREEIDALLKGPLFLVSDNVEAKNERISELIYNDYKNKTPYVEKILSYVAKNASVFVVIDNVDQFEKEGQQERIFSNAAAIAHRLGLNVILALRDVTFLKRRNHPIFDAFDFDSIYIDPPNIISVLARRFFVARELVSGRSVSFETDKGIHVQVSNLGTFMEILQASVVGTYVSEIIDVLASGDVRLALRMTREFLQYGYSAPEKALRIKNYVLPRHEALRGIMVGNRDTYSDIYSVMGNPFDAHLEKTSAQLLRLFILSALVRKSSERSFDHVEGGEIKETMATLGFSEEICLKVLKDLCTRRFINSESQSEVSFDSTYFPTRLGGYIVRDLISNFTFLENVLIDTFISNPDHWQELKNLTDEIHASRNMMQKFHKRKNRACVFYEAMKEAYTVLQGDAVRRGLPPEWCGNPLEDMEDTFKRNLARATRSAEQNIPHRLANT